MYFSLVGTFIILRQRQEVCRTPKMHQHIECIFGSEDECKNIIFTSLFANKYLRHLLDLMDLCPHCICVVISFVTPLNILCYYNSFFLKDYSISLNTNTKTEIQLCSYLVRRAWIGQVPNDKSSLKLQHSAGARKKTPTVYLSV